MKINRSPWIHQLNHERKTVTLSKDVNTDIVIVGAGIAGISSAFYILKHTDKKVVVIEKSKIAHGATGHNAGQVVSYFERPFCSIVDEFGLEMAAEAVISIEGAWDLMTEMYTEANLNIPFSRFVGYSGFSTYEQVIESLKDGVCRKSAGLDVHTMLVAKESAIANSIPEEYKDYYVLVGQNEILEKLETENKVFIALSSMQKGTINSALFCQEIASYLLEKYRDRFTLYEDTRINKIVLKEKNAILDAIQNEIDTKHIILCTNGFETMSIVNTSGLDIDTRFHHNVEGVVARMSGYLETMNKPPAAISYHISPVEGFGDMNDPYFYLTRRMYEHEKGSNENLICVGGPEHPIADREEYLYEFDYPDEVPKEIDDFVKKNYDRDPNKKIEYKFTWHGLMGYTPNRIRLIGSEPKNPILLYNLGCNGIGILPSIYGGRRIASILAGEKIRPSIFDPQISPDKK